MIAAVRQYAAHVALMLAVACISGRSFYPSEDADSGTGLPFLPLALLAALGGLVAWLLPATDRSRLPALAGTHLRRGSRPRKHEPDDQTDVGPLARSTLILPDRVGSVMIGSTVTLLCLIAASAVTASYRYPAVNLALEAVAIVAVSASLRLAAAALGTGTVRNTIVAAVIGLAIVQAAVAVYQVAFFLPDLHRRLQQNDPRLLADMRAAGMDPDNRAVRDRLLSKEPFGTFGLANSLAGYLLLAVPLLAGSLPGIAPAAASLSARAGAFLFFPLVVGAIALTKSRSALAVVLLFAIVAGASRLGTPSTRKRYAWWGIAAVLTFILIAGGLTVAGQFDALDVMEAPKSLRYRLEYWRASLPIIAEHPWLGVGPGNFANAYLRHKLPFSSEEIREPHHWGVELACTVGLPALGMYLLLLTATVLSLGRAGRSSAEPPVDAPGRPAAVPLVGGTWVGLGIVVLGNWLPAAGFDVALAGGLIVPIVMLFLAPRYDAAVAAWLSATSLVGWHLHGLFSGAFLFPVLPLTVWSLAAAAKPKPPTPRAWTIGTSPRALPWVKYGGLLLGLGGAAVLSTGLVAAWTWRVSPWLKREQIRSSLRMDEEGVRLKAEIELLPGDAETWGIAGHAAAAILRQECEKLLAGRPCDDECQLRSRRALALARRAWSEAARLDPGRSAYWRDVMRLEWSAAALGIDPEASARGAEAARQMIERYPNSAVRQWEAGMAVWLASTEWGEEQADAAGRRKGILALALAGDSIGDQAETFLAIAIEKTPPARRATAVPYFNRALWLDQTPHPDKRLTPAAARLARRFSSDDASRSDQ